MTKASKLVKLLTGTDIKKLSGLDDIKVEQGRENFKNIWTYIDELFGPEESYALKKRIDDVENFHKTDFEHHLERLLDYSCACMTRGFHDKGESLKSDISFIRLFVLSFVRSFVCPCLMFVRIEHERTNE